MSRKDYIRIAAALKDSRAQTFNDPQLIKAADHQHALTAMALATALKEDNSRFDRERFLKAAGVLT